MRIGVEGRRWLKSDIIVGENKFDFILDYHINRTIDDPKVSI